MNSRQTVIPNLFIVGAPKCGTTALHTYLGQHPEIFMAKDKENNHFATDLLPLTDPFRADERYFSMFRDVTQEKAVGESSVFYMLSKEAAINIYRFNPEAKIIIMLRNPVEMLPSYHAQMVYNGDEDILNFEKALAAEDRRRNGKLKIKPGLRFDERLFYREVISYSTQIKRYLSLFNRDQIFIIIYDDFKADTSGVYHEVLKFIGVKPYFQTDFPIINQRKTYSYYRHSNLIKVIKKHIPEPLHQHLKYFFHPKSISTTPSQINHIIHMRLRNQISAEIEELGNLLSRDLNAWSYSLQ